MEKDIKIKIIKLTNLLNDISWTISNAEETLGDLEIKIKEKNEKVIKDVDNLKRELKRDGLYSDKLEDFLENYMKYYNK